MKSSHRYSVIHAVYHGTQLPSTPEPPPEPVLEVAEVPAPQEDRDYQEYCRQWEARKNQASAAEQAAALLGLAANISIVKNVIDGVMGRHP